MTCWRPSRVGRPWAAQRGGRRSILRWHALSGYSLELTQFTGGRVTIEDGTGALLAAIADAAVFDRRLDDPCRGGGRQRRDVEVHTRDGEAFTAAARSSPSR